MKKYNKYKDSGIEWIGEIPEHWDVKKLKFISKICNGQDQKAVLDDNGIYPIYGSGGIFGKSNSFLFDQPSVLLGRKGTIDKPQYVEEPFWTVDTSYYTKIKDGFSTRLFYYLCKTINFELYKYGSAIPSMTQGHLNEIKFSIPNTLEEQTTIANYLDQKTTQIDSLIAKKEQFITLLQEERTAVINQAVTKGLDPKVQLKDSGIEWLGEIPEHWEVKKLKYLLKESKDSLKTGPFGSHIKNSDYIPNGDFKVYTQRNVLDNEYENGCESISEEKFKELKGFTIYEGDVLITTRGSIGRCSIFPMNMATGILHPCLIRIQVNENLSLRNWIVNYINNTSLFYNNVKFNSNSTIIDVIYGYTLKEIFFPSPPINEQKIILEFLEVKINEINTLISNSQQEIELLKEYKTALISEVVTGKVDVRDEVLN